MYEFILQTKLATLFAAVVVAWLAASMAGKPQVALRSMLFNYGPSFACAFFVVGAFYDGQVSAFDLAAGLLFEFSVLVAFAKLFCDALREVRLADDEDVENWLVWSFAIQVLVALPIVTSEGFGIFSEGSRIAYLDEGSAAKYLTYAGVLVSAVQAGLIAHRVSAMRSFGIVGYSVIVGTFAVSTLSGSKGAFFLWFASVLALIDYNRVRIRWLPILVGLIVVCGALVSTANIVSETLGISDIEFAELALSRFFLNNDARALAFDFGGVTGQTSELIAASFRVLSARFGHPPIDPQLGLVLYERYFGVSTGNGPNASVMALIAYYSLRGYAFLPALIACLGLAVTYAVVLGLRHMVSGHLKKLGITLMGLTLIQQLSQDFLAFPLLVALACAAAFIFIVIDRKPAGVRHRRLPPSPRFAGPEHHRSRS